MGKKKETFSFDIEGVTEVLNQGKDLFIQKMLQENIITENQFKEMSKHSIVASNKSTLGNFVARMWGDKSDGTKIVIVKNLTSIED